MQKILDRLAIVWHNLQFVLMSFGAGIWFHLTLSMIYYSTQRDCMNTQSCISSLDSNSICTNRLNIPFFSMWLAHCQLKLEHTANKYLLIKCEYRITAQRFRMCRQREIQISNTCHHFFIRQGSARYYCDTTKYEEKNLANVFLIKTNVRWN